MCAHISSILYINRGGRQKKLDFIGNMSLSGPLTSEPPFPFSMYFICLCTQTIEVSQKSTQQADLYKKYFLNIFKVCAKKNTFISGGGPYWTFLTPSLAMIIIKYISKQIVMKR